MISRVNAIRFGSIVILFTLAACSMEKPLQKVAITQESWPSKDEMVFLQLCQSGVLLNSQGFPLDQEKLELHLIRAAHYIAPKPLHIELLATKNDKVSYEDFLIALSQIEKAAQIMKQPLVLTVSTR